MVDTGRALYAVATKGDEALVKLMLQQQQRRRRRRETDGGETYVNTRDEVGSTPLLRPISSNRYCSPEIARLSVDAGADTASSVRLVLTC